jgi:hypothetical protein
MKVLEIETLPRHKVAALNRGGKHVYDEAAATGIVLDATANRPELVMMAASEIRRQQGLLKLGVLAAEVLSDVTPLLHGLTSTAPHVAWLSVFDLDEMRQFTTEFSQAVRLSMATGNPDPALKVVHRWRSTAEYAVAGAPLSGEIDWDEIVELHRPEFDEAEA